MALEDRVAINGNGEKEIAKILAKEPGPMPWYVKQQPPIIREDGRALVWIDAEKIGGKKRAYIGKVLLTMYEKPDDVSSTKLLPSLYPISTLYFIPSEDVRLIAGVYLSGIQ